MKTKIELQKTIDELIDEMNTSFLTRDEEAEYWKDITELQEQIRQIEDKERGEAIQDAIAAMRENRFHDWLCYNSGVLTREDLVSILGEYVYQLERFNPVCTIDGGRTSEEVAEQVGRLVSAN